MSHQDKTICIFGGSGFLGRYITQDLARAGYRIKIATRVPESAYALKTYGNVGQIVPFQCNYNDPKSIQNAVTGCYGVINLIGILYEKGKSKFLRAHVDIPQMIAQACHDAKVEKFIHVSALAVERGTDKEKSKYARSKFKGEEAVKKAFKDVTILRPSVVFGAGDNFFNMFARLATILPALPLIGGGNTKFQPVYVGDIAQAIANIMNDQTQSLSGKIYELGGPQIVTFKQIYEMMLATTNRNNALISVPWMVAKIQGLVFGMMPKPLLTLDQVKSLKTDNILSEKSLRLENLGVTPTAMQTILPTYLACYKRGGRFANKKSA